ncbi:hypothetical protein ACUUL3_06700 [Thiovibrio sp. JS02]
MRYNSIHCVLMVSVFLPAFCCGPSWARASEEQAPQQAAGAGFSPPPEEAAVSYETNGAFFWGYRFLSTEDSPKAAEYIYPHSSATFGLDLLSCPLPYRYHVNAEYLSAYDFYADAGFAYKDLVLFRDILVGAHHNLEHFDYRHPGEPPGLVYTDGNAGENYYTDFTSNLLTLRLKAPDFPFHTFLRHRHIERDGRIQQRFLLGDFSALNKVSEARDIDWKSNAVTLGANSHAGPVEIEYAFDRARFSPGPHSVLYDSYPASVDFARPGDIYPHNVVPETESSAHSVKLHSSYTGGLVTAASLGNLQEKNNYSRTEATTWKGAFDFSWLPDPLIGLFFKYRHKTVDMDTADDVTLLGLLGSSLDYSVREGISYNEDLFSLSSRYRPLNLLTLFAGYEFSHLERKDVAAWEVLPGQTNIHGINFGAHLRPADKVKVKASYDYKAYDDPSYNNTPDNSNKLRLTTTYTPRPWLNVYLQYLLALTERDSLRYLNSDPALILEFGERDGRRDQFLASVSTELSAKLNLTFSWFYQRWDVDQDLAYGKWLGPGAGDMPYVDFAVPYSDEAHSYVVSLHYLPREDITCTAGVTYTVIEGESGYEDVVTGQQFSLASYSALKGSETIFSLEIGKKISKEWEVGLRSYLDIYNDRAYDVLDGNVVTTTINIKRHF